VSAVAKPPAPVRDPAPELRFTVSAAEPLAYAAAPTLKFGLEIDAPGGQPIRSLLLDVQIQIAARRRGYGQQAQERLLELFGMPERWSSTLRTLPWLRTTLVVPAFTSASSVELTVACTYDLEVTASRYLAALEEGEIPLEFMFSGSVFYAATDGRLQMARIPWDNDVAFGMPVDVWRRTMDAHFPQSAWLRLHRESYDALYAYKARHAFETWEATIDALLRRDSEVP
jgi:hypothetical protein